MIKKDAYHTCICYTLKMQTIVMFSGLIRLVDFLPFLTKKTTFMTSCLLSCNLAPSEKRGPTLKWKNLLSFCADFFLFRRETKQFNVPASVAQLDAPSDWRPGGHGFKPRRGRQHSFVEIDHEIFSTVILSLPLIQEGQLSVSCERMCRILVNRLED